MKRSLFIVCTCLLGLLFLLWHSNEVETGVPTPTRDALLEESFSSEPHPGRSPGPLAVREPQPHPDLQPDKRSKGRSLDGLSGRIADQNDVAVAGADVLLRYSSSLSALDPLEAQGILRERVLGRHEIHQAAVAVRSGADEQGIYFVSMEGRPAGVYQVVAAGNGLSPRRKLWLWEGESGQMDFRLGPADIITGTVLNSVGRPVQEAEVLAFTQGDEGRGNWSGERELVNQTESGADGTFRLDVYPGVFLLRANGHGYLPSVLQGVTSASSGLRIVLSAGQTLEGRVEDQGGTAIAEAKVSYWPGDTVGRWQEITVAQSALGRPYRRCVSSADGVFRVDSLPVGRFGLLTKKSGYVPQVTHGELDQTGGPLVKVLLSPGRVLTGRVVDDSHRPVAGALVAVELSRSNRSLVEPSDSPRQAAEDKGKDVAVLRDLTVERAWERVHQPIALSRATAIVETKKGTG